MALKPGIRLQSQVCSTEVIVVKAAGDDVDLRCGGAPMVMVGTEHASHQRPAQGLDTGTLLGKRYTGEATNAQLELLVTKAGTGTLSAGDAPLAIKDSRALPSSD